MGERRRPPAEKVLFGYLGAAMNMSPLNEAGLIGKGYCSNSYKNLTELAIADQAGGNYQELRIC
jgi:hypothetical protein